MNPKEGKKSQITIFIIVGMLLVLGIILIFSIGNISKDQSTALQQEEQEIKTFVESCMRTSLFKAIAEIDYSETDKLERYLNNKIKECTSKFEIFKGVTVIEGEVKSEIVLNQEDPMVYLEIDYPLTIRKGVSSFRLSKFSISHDLTSSTSLIIEDGLTSSPSRLYSPDSSLTLFIPQGINASVNGNQILSITLRIKSSTDYSNSNPGFLIYDIEPDGAIFDKPLEISLSYLREIIPEYVNESNMTISYLNNGVWHSLPSYVDTENRIIYANITHFTEFTLMFNTHPKTKYDFDGDGKADLGVYWPLKYPESSRWYIIYSSGRINNYSSLAMQDTNNVGYLAYGWDKSKIDIHDFDGDGKADIAVYSSTPDKLYNNDSWVWYIVSSQYVSSTIQEFANIMKKDQNNNPYHTTPEFKGEIAISEDYDGDGKADIGVYNITNHQWHIFKTTTGTPTTLSWGTEEAIPVPADYDGDGTIEPAVYIPGKKDESGNDLNAKWYILGYNDNEPLEWGFENTIPVPADYDGDGKAELGVYSPDNFKWYILGYNDNKPIDWGFDNVIPVPADYDGDGKTDIAVYSPEIAGWYILFSSRIEPAYLASSTIRKTQGEVIYYTWGFEEGVPLSIIPSLYHSTGFVSSVGGRNIASIGEEEFVSTLSYGRQVDIATDSKANPHIVTEKNSQGTAIAYSYKNNIWNTKLSFLTVPGQDSGIMPKISIDNQDNAWVSVSAFSSGVRSSPSSAGYVCLVQNILSNPTKTRCQYTPIWNSFNGRADIDPEYPGFAWYGGDAGGPQKVWKFSADGSSVVEEGTFSLGATAEPIDFRISPRPGQQGVWHIADNQLSVRSNAHYTNSLINTIQSWDSNEAGIDSDKVRPTIGIDLTNPAIAYLAVGRNGVRINVWDGNKMLFGSSAKVIDSTAGYGNGMARVGPKFAPAKGGGAFLCWTSGDGRIKIKYLSSEGEASFGETLDIAQGSQCAIATDLNGNIHLAYNNNGLKYRLIKTI